MSSNQPNHQHEHQPHPHGDEQAGPASNVAHLRLESRPQSLILNQVDRLPFPNIGPVQEVVFDLGLTAYGIGVTLTGLVFKGYSGHQELFEQRWPGRMIQQRIGESDLHIAAQTGLAVRTLHFMLHAYEPLTMIEVTAVAKYDDADETIHSVLQIPVQPHIQQTDVHFPLAGTWWAIQGADWSDRHKIESYSQPFALDFVKLGEDNQFFRDAGARLEEHYSWDAPVYATAGGKVAYVCYDMPDITPGQVPDPRMFRDDPRRLLGNAVAISHANGEFSYYAHLQQVSLAVNEGQMIRRGELIGRVGNSGQSPGPHLHFHLMEGPNLFIDRGLPVRFSHFWAGGQYFEAPMTIPTRMIVTGPARADSSPS